MEKQEFVNAERKTPISTGKLIIKNYGGLSSVILHCKRARLGSTVCGLHRECDDTICLWKSLQQPVLPTH